VAHAHDHHHVIILGVCIVCCSIPRKPVHKYWNVARARVPRVSVSVDEFIPSSVRASPFRRRRPICGRHRVRARRPSRFFVRQRVNEDANRRPPDGRANRSFLIVYIRYDIIIRRPRACVRFVITKIVSNCRRTIGGAMYRYRYTPGA